MNLEQILQKLNIGANEIYKKGSGAYAYKRNGIEYAIKPSGGGWAIVPSISLGSSYQKGAKVGVPRLRVNPDGSMIFEAGAGKRYKNLGAVSGDWESAFNKQIETATGQKIQEDAAAAARRQAVGNVVSAGGANNIYNVNSPTQATTIRSDAGGGQGIMPVGSEVIKGDGTSTTTAPDYNAQFDAYWEPINALLNQRYQDVLVPEFNRYTMNPFNSQYAHNAAQNYQSMIGAGKQQYEDKRSYIANQFENQVDTMRQNAMKDALNVWQGQQSDIQDNTDLTQALAPYIEKYASWTPEPVKSSQTSNPVYSQLVTPGAMKDIYSSGKPPVYPGGLTLSKPN